MPTRRRVTPPAGPGPVEALEHADKRVNIPTADAKDFVSAAAAAVQQVRYPRDPSLDPQLVWRGKDTGDADDLVADAPPIYIQEKIDPRVLVENLRSRSEEPMSLFDGFDGLEPLDKVDFYQHGANWSNRLILGDSLQVMASLAEKENLRGQVQMVYLDPPYGIKFGSNWQVSTRKRDVKDGKVEDATREVEQIKAFRDTWELGIHSYLPYLRDRLAAARDLLTESGSCFVQIGDENVHLVRSLMDEVFGSENFVSLITYKKTTSSTGDYLAGVNDYIIWYAKLRDRCRYRTLFQTRTHGSTGAGQYNWFETEAGERAPASDEQLRGKQIGRLLRRDQLTSQGAGRAKGEGEASWFTVEIADKKFTPGTARWKTNEPGMNRLRAADRLMPVGNTLTYVRYFDDFPAFPFSNLWDDTVTSGFGDPKTYVVQTNTKVIERCMLMTTDPGDLVLDPTCGSGTTAYVAEQWGRRWITTDTSRVAVALARQRLMGAKLPYYLLADSPAGRAKEQELSGEPSPTGPTAEDVRKGFVYARVPHVTLKSIANNPDIVPGMSRAEIDAAIARHAETEVLYDKPAEDRKRVRVAGRFTVESVSPHRTATFGAEEPVPDRAEQGGEDAFLRTVRDNLLAAGVQNGRKSERLIFESLETYGHPLVQFVGERRGGGNGSPQRVAVSVGPQYGTVDGEWVKRTAREALRGQGFDLLVICGFAFDAHASGTAAEFGPGNATDFAAVHAERAIGLLPVLLVRMNAELAMGDAVLKKTGTANLFTMFGEPDVQIERAGGQVVVRLRGVDVYNPTTGVIRSNDTTEIALWMIDSDYDEESFFVRHCYFSGGGTDPYGRLKRALKAEIDEAAWAGVYGTVSRPFPPPKSGRIAIKVVNHYGDEVLKVFEVA